MRGGKHKSGKKPPVKCDLVHSGRCGQLNGRIGVTAMCESTHKCGHEMDLRNMGRGLAREQRIATKAKTLCVSCHRQYLAEQGADMCVLLPGFDRKGKRN